MAYDKVVDSAVLDADLTKIADAIRARTGTSDRLEFPDAMEAAIAAIDTSENLDTVLAEQDALIEEIRAALETKAAGGGININAVTASLLPATVAEGQIVVLTSTAAPNIYLGYAAPDSPAAGDIWIHTVDTEAGYPFVIGTATLKPGATVQYNGSAWEYRDAYIGVSGTWQLFSTLSPLADLSWEQIIAIANSNEDCSKFFAVGDEAVVSLSDGQSVPVVIGDFAHNTITGTDTKAAIAFSSKNCLGATGQMNDTATNAGGWDACTMRTSRMATVLNAFPAALRAEGAIKCVEVVASKGASTSDLITSSDRLRLHSITELGVSHGAAHVEGTTYAYYTSGNRVKTIGGSATTYFTRSASGVVQQNYCTVVASGTGGQSAATANHGVACAFDI